MQYYPNNNANKSLPRIHYKLLKDKLIRLIIKEAVEQYKYKNSYYSNYFNNVNGAYYRYSHEDRNAIYNDFKQLMNKLKVNLNIRPLSTIENLYRKTVENKNELEKAQILQNIIDERPVEQQIRIMPGRRKIYYNKYADIYMKNLYRNSNYQRIQNNGNLLSLSYSRRQNNYRW